MPLGQLRLVIKRVNLTKPATSHDVNHSLRLRHKMRRRIGRFTRDNLSSDVAGSQQETRERRAAQARLSPAKEATSAEQGNGVGSEVHNSISLDAHTVNVTGTDFHRNAGVFASS